MLFPSSYFEVKGIDSNFQRDGLTRAGLTRLVLEDLFFAGFRY